MTHTPIDMTDTQMRDYLTWFSLTQRQDAGGVSEYADIAGELARAFDTNDSRNSFSDAQIAELRGLLTSATPVYWRGCLLIVRMLEALWEHSPHTTEVVEEFLFECQPRIVDLEGKDFRPAFGMCYEMVAFNSVWRGKIITYNRDETTFSLYDCSANVIDDYVLTNWHHFQYIPMTLPLLSGSVLMDNVNIA